MIPDDIDALKAALIAERAERIPAQAVAAAVQAKLSEDQALIAHMKLQIEKLRRAIYGQRSERSVRLLDQMELQLEELEAAATEDELLAEMAAAKTTGVAAFTRKRPARKPFPVRVVRRRGSGDSSVGDMAPERTLYTQVYQTFVKYTGHLLRQFSVGERHVFGGQNLTVI